MRLAQNHHQPTRKNRLSVGQTFSIFPCAFDLSAQVDKQLTELSRIKTAELAEFNKQYSAKGLPVVSSNR